MFFRSQWVVHAEGTLITKVLSTHCVNRGILRTPFFSVTLKATILVELKEKLRLIYTSCEKVTLNLRYGRLKRKAFIRTSYVHFHQLIW